MQIKVVLYVLLTVALIGGLLLSNGVFAGLKNRKTLLQDAHQKLKIQVFTGSEAKKYFKEIANIRLSLFREYPYLYIGTVPEEEEYLETYFKSPDSRILLVFDQGKVVGFSSSIPLSQEMPEVQAPFIEKNLKCDEYLYIGEVMLYPAYRGQGIARKFLEFHEQRARDKGYRYTTFMTVERPENHPYKPKDFQSYDALWQHFGYIKFSDIKVSWIWTQVDTGVETPNTLALWYKKV